MPRLQLNIRMDNEPELYQEVRDKASLLNTSINDFVISALKASLGWQAPVDSVKMMEKIYQLEQRVAKLEKSSKNR